MSPANSVIDEGDPEKRVKIRAPIAWSPKKLDDKDKDIAPVIYNPQQATTHDDLPFDILDKTTKPLTGRPLPWGWTEEDGEEKKDKKATPKKKHKWLFRAFYIGRIIIKPAPNIRPVHSNSAT